MYTCEDDGINWEVTKGTKEPLPRVSSLDAQLAEVKALFKQKYGYEVSDDDTELPSFECTIDTIWSDFYANLGAVFFGDHLEAVMDTCAESAAFDDAVKLRVNAAVLKTIDEARGHSIKLEGGGSWAQLAAQRSSFRMGMCGVLP